MRICLSSGSAIRAVVGIGARGDSAGANDTERGGPSAPIHFEICVAPTGTFAREFRDGANRPRLAIGGPAD